MAVNIEFIILLFGCLLINETVQNDTLFRFDYTYDDNLQGWIKLHRVPAPWHEARKKCSYEGALLSSPVNGNMISRYHYLLSSHEIPNLYTGIHGTFAKGEFVTVDGIPLSRIPDITWQPNNKINTGTDQCLIMGHYGLGTVECTEEYPFACFRKFTKHSYDSLCGTTDEGYTFEESVGKCYKLHTHEVTWSEAYEICLAEGGYLAIPKNETDAYKLRETLKTKLIENNIYNTNEFAMVGIVMWGYNSETRQNTFDWYTIHGDAIETTYNRWSGDARTGVFAGLTQDGLLVKLYEDSKNLFICEKDPSSLL